MKNKNLLVYRWKSYTHVTLTWNEFNLDIWNPYLRKTQELSNKRRLMCVRVSWEQPYKCKTIPDHQIFRYYNILLGINVESKLTGGGGLICLCHHFELGYM